jgi:hypothetical protein
MKGFRHVRAVMAAANAAQWDRAYWEVGTEDDVPTRRALLSGLLAVAATPRDAVDRLIAASTGKDDLAAYRELVSTYAAAYYRTPPRDLQLAVTTLLDRLTEMQTASLSPATRGQLSRIAADVAGFAGYLAYDTGQTGLARSHFTLAAETAKFTADARLYALALASEGTTWAPAANGSGDARRSLALLNQAALAYPADGPARDRAWVQMHTANRHALVGDGRGFSRHVREVSDALEVMGGDGPTDGFYSRTGWFALLDDRDRWFAEYMGRGLHYLGSPDAISILQDVRTDDPRRLATTLEDLFAAQAAQGDYVAAADAGLRCVNVARTNRLPRRLTSMRNTRTSFGPVPALQELDAALSA